MSPCRPPACQPFPAGPRAARMKTLHSTSHLLSGREAAFIACQAPWAGPGSVHLSICPQDCRAPRGYPGDAAGWQMATMTSDPRVEAGRCQGRPPPLQLSHPLQPVTAKLCAARGQTNQGGSGAPRGSEQQAAIRLHAPAPGPARPKQNESIHYHQGQLKSRQAPKHKTPQAVHSHPFRRGLRMDRAEERQWTVVGAFLLPHRGQRGRHLGLELSQGEPQAPRPGQPLHTSFTESFQYFC